MKEYKYKINGNEYNVKVDETEETAANVEVNGKSFKVEWEKREGAPAPKPVARVASAPKAAAPAAAPQPAQAAPTSGEAPAGSHAIKTPLPGVILDVKVNVGDTIKRGQTLVILEAMKMENNINADADGKIVAIKVSKGQSVLENTELVYIG